MIILKGDKGDLIVKFSEPSDKIMNISIRNSYLIKPILEIEKKLFIITHDDEYINFIRRGGYQRTVDDMMKEWCAHNLLYDLHILRNRTKDTDLEYKQKPIVKFGYSVLYFIYKIFHRKKVKNK